MKLGIVGCGMIVQDVLSHWDCQGFTLEAILGTERSREKVLATAERYGIRQCFFEEDAFLNSGVEAVYVALPNHLHYAFAKKALERGKHVILEKPCVTTADQWEDLWQTARQRDALLLEAMNIHYLPAYRAMKSEMANLGSLRIVSLNYSQYSSRYDAFKAGQILPAFDCHKAGGALMDLNIYNIHAVVGLFGRPQRVHYQANVDRGIDTSGILTLDYGSFQAVCIGAKDCRAPIRCSFQGDRGCILVEKPMSQMTSYTLLDNSGGEATRSFGEGVYRLKPEFDAFARILRDRDWETAAAMAEHSAAATWIQETARKQAGIVFD